MSKALYARIRKAAEILKAAGAKDVFLFGSAASGSMRKDSDVDLAVTGLPPRNFFAAMGRAHDALGCSLDLVDLDEESPFTRHLKVEGALKRVG